MTTAYPTEKIVPPAAAPLPWVAQMAVKGKGWDILSYQTTPATKVAREMTRTDAENVVRLMNATQKDAVKS